MILDDSHLDDLLKASFKAALTAGKIIEDSKTEFINVNKKYADLSLATSVVTEVDLKSQEAILEVLNDSIKKYDLGLLAEESKDDCSRFEKDYFWSVDPLDGTLPFTEGRDGYSVSIALVSKKGIPVLGTIYDPNTATIYHALKAKGAFKNNKPLKVKTCCGETLSLYIHRSFLKSRQYSKYIGQVKKIAEVNGIGALEIRSYGAAAMNGCWLIENDPGIYMVIPKKESGGGSLWDYAASSLIVEEAGGYAKDFFGGAIELNKKETTFLNHNGILMATNLNLIPS